MTPPDGSVRHRPRAVAEIGSRRLRRSEYRSDPVRALEHANDIRNPFRSSLQDVNGVPGNHNVHRGTGLLEAFFDQKTGERSAPCAGGETVIGDDEDIGDFGHATRGQAVQQSSELLVDGLEDGERLGRTDPSGVGSVVWLGQPGGQYVCIGEVEADP